MPEVYLLPSGAFAVTDRVLPELVAHGGRWRVTAGQRQLIEAGALVAIDGDVLEVTPQQPEVPGERVRKFGAAVRLVRTAAPTAALDKQVRVPLKGEYDDLVRNNQ